jgi:hypothetical protein
LSYDLFLESIESPLSFTVEHRHIHAKEAEKAVGLILDPGRPSFRSPGHLLSDVASFQLAVYQHRLRDGCDGFDHGS